VAGGAWAVVAFGVLLAGVWRRRQDRARRAALDIGWTLPEDDAADEGSAPEPSVLDPDPRP
jgi:hypothetical protein